MSPGLQEDPQSVSCMALLQTRSIIWPGGLPQEVKAESILDFCTVQKFFRIAHGAAVLI